MQDRAQTARQIAQTAGSLALEYFRQINALKIEVKNQQDFVTEADRAVELHIREMIAQAYPDDGIIGEEHAPKDSRTGYTWVIDPIDGTANFVTSIPQWCVIIAVVKEDQTEVGVIHDPVHNETFWAVHGKGANLNDAPLVCPADTSLTHGRIGTGFSNHVPPKAIVALIDEITRRGGYFQRNGSGGLTLAYVASGRLIGYVEGFMHAWDCLAGMLIITEAGGKTVAKSTPELLKSGGRVVVGSKGIFDELLAITEDAFKT